MLGDPISDPKSFRLEAAYQRVCALCGKAKPFHAHHVVHQKLIGRMGLPEYDTRNALRLCAPPRHCHLTFEARMLVLPLVKLTDDNIEYAYEVLDTDLARSVGAQPAYDYLVGRYSGEDPRVTLRAPA